MAITAQERTQIEKLIVAMYNAAPGAQYLSELTTAFEANGHSLLQLARDLSGTASYQALNPVFQTASEFATAFLTPYGLQANTDAIAFVTAKFNAGLSKGQISYEAALAIDAYVGADATIIAAKAIQTNKALVSEYYSVTKGIAQTNVATLQSAVSGVGATDASVSSAKANIDSGATGITGQVFTLTTAGDTLTGTANNDTFNASLIYASAGVTVDPTSSLSVSDTINGGAGVDTLNVTISGGNATTAFAAATISNVEILNLRNVSGNTNTLDASTIAGLTNINSDRSTSAVTLTNLATTTAAGMIGNGTVANGALNVAYKTATDPITLNLTGGVVNAANAAKITVTGTGTAATINSTGAANAVDTVALGTASVGTLTINADSNLTTGAISGFKASAAVTVKGLATTVNIGALDTNVATVDASGLTAGGLTATLSAVTQKITGGAGNDTITTGGVLTTGSVDAGAGTGDRLVVAAAADIAATPAAKYTNFEILRNTAGGATLDVSTVTGITSIELGATGQGATRLTAAQAAAVTNLVDNATQTLSLIDASGTSDVLGVTLKAATAATTASLTASTITGFETLNVTSSSGTIGTAATGNVLSFAAAGNLTALNVAGANDLAITTTNITKAVTIASTQTGLAALNVTGTLTKGSVVTTTANADAITTTATVVGTTGDFVTYNAGAGNDTITTTLAGLNNTSAGTGSVKIDGGAGTDTVSTDGNTYADANFQFITNVEKLTFTGTAAVVVTTGGFFDTNFKTAGVTFTAATLAGASSIDASTFTGAVTTALTEAAATATDSFIVKSGSANDTIALTTSGALTTSTNAISTGAGNDTVTVTAAALGAGGKFSVNLGSGDDKVTLAFAGAGAADITGGTGIDTIGLSAGHTGVMNVIQATGDSATFAKPASNTISTASFDVVTGAKAADTITISSNTTSSTVVQVTDLSAGTYANDSISQVKGTYDASAKTFVAAAAGADTLVVYDSTTGATVTLEAIVIVGNANTATAAAGVVSLA